LTSETGPGRVGACRVGIDVGGTFTDFVLYDPAARRLTAYKEPSTPDDPSLGVARGLGELLERADVAPSNVGLIVHGTTLGLNTVLERTGARTALIVSRGNRDILELARSKMPSPYDFSIPKEQPLVPRDLVFEVSARSGAEGSVVERPETTELRTLAEVLPARKVEAVAVVLLNSYLDAALEDEVAEALESALDDVLITRSARVWPEMREYERAMIATMNAYVSPSLNAYFSRLERRLAGAGVDAPLYITSSAGGTLDVATARAQPVTTLLSGPASGVVAASAVARSAGQTAIIALDMGGTSCDMSVSQAGEPEYTTATHVGEFPLMAPVINVSAIGAGGGSVVWVDGQGVIKVGPQSAGADPGPVCYGQGGSRPTVTDCYLVAGVIAPEAFLGGRMRLDRAAAEAALAKVADSLGMSGEARAVQAADAALQVATAKMAAELYKAMAQRGLDPRDFMLIPHGGAGPTHAALLAEEANVKAICVPAAPGTLCALGAILSDVKRDDVRSVRCCLDAEGALDRLEAAFREMEVNAEDWIKMHGRRVTASRFVYGADMRYVGQAYEIAVQLPADERAALGVEGLTELLHREHERVYGFRDPESAVEAISVRLRIVGSLPPLALPELEPAKTTARPAGRRRVHLNGAWYEATVYRGAGLAAGHQLAGPAVVELEDSTVCVPAGWQAAVDHLGNIQLAKTDHGRS